VRTQFDHFQLVEAIASGGMGPVYKARDMNLDRIVALKLLRKEFSVDQEYIEKLETEAKITASVSHPNVVKVFSFGCDQGLYYIAMELVDKGSLDDLMGLQGRIAEVQVLEIGIQVAQGLNAAMEAGLIHRDVKPGNILFADARTSKIVDFGLAMPLEQARDAEGGEIWGTPYYVAPEKLNHEPEDFRSDIYSLGGTLFHALAGRPPFEADNASMVALKHIKSQVVSLQAFAPDISSPTAYVINRTLAKDPNERYQSYTELVEHLEYARAKLLENSGKPRQVKARVVMEDENQQKLLGYILMAVIGFTLILGVVLYIFKDSIMSRNMSLADIERNRLLKASNSAEENYSIARRMIFEGDSESAVPVLWQLGNRPNLPQSLKSWIYLQGGIASYFSGLSVTGREAIDKLSESVAGPGAPSEQELSDFLLDLSSRASQNSVSVESAIKDYSTQEFHSIGLLLLGLKEWDSQRFDSGNDLLSAFLSVQPSGNWTWINSYKPQVQRYVDDYNSVKDLLAEIKQARTAAARSALKPKVEGIRMNLVTYGRFSDYLATQERLFSAATAGGAPSGGVSFQALREQAMREIREFRPEAARKLIDNAISSSAGRDDFSVLSRRVHFAEEFKKQLITDLNKQGFSVSPIVKRNNTQLIGKIVKAGDFRVEVELPNGTQSILWSELKDDFILKMALSMIKGRAGAALGDADINRLWLCGAYAALINNRAEALPRLMRAAESKREYARELHLFDNLSR
jgi:serine/threonine protein kinase